MLKAVFLRLECVKTSNCQNVTRTILANYQKDIRLSYINDQQRCGRRWKVCIYIICAHVIVAFRPNV